MSLNRHLDADGIFQFIAEVKNAILTIKLIYGKEVMERQFNIERVIASDKLTKRYKKAIDEFIETITVNMIKNLINSKKKDIFKALNSA